MAIRAILFDLDGTLVQTREASWLLFEETNRQFGLGIDSREQFFGLFQNNFFRSLAERCGDPERLAQVKRHFVGLLRTRYTPPLVPGMADVVRALADRFTLVVLSTNTTETIRRILTGAGIAHCFAHVFAGDVEPDKTVSMQRFLGDGGYRLGRRCSPGYDESGPGRFEDGDEVVLITDTVGDIREANSAGVRAIGVAWGMHREDELSAAGAERVALWPQELCAWILPDADAPSLPGACSRGACGCKHGAAGSAAPSRSEPAASLEATCSCKAGPAESSGAGGCNRRAATSSLADAANELVRVAADIRRQRRLSGSSRRVHAGIAEAARTPAAPALGRAATVASARDAPIDPQLLATLKRLRRSS